MKKTAFFQHRPRRAEDLRRPHRLEEEQAYRVTDIVILPDIDYENFAEDLLADRAFLEQAASCVLVRTKHGREGILVRPEGAFVKQAALITLKR